MSERPHLGYRRARRRVAILGALVLIIVITAVVVASAAPGGDTLPATTHSATTAWPANAAGQTYGSAAKAKSPTDLPDLVSVVAANGKVGYVLSTDLAGGKPSTPEETEAYNEAYLRGREIPVYEADGATQIGVFVVGGPGSEITVTRADGTTTTKSANSDGAIVTTTKAADGSVVTTTE